RVALLCIGRWATVAHSICQSAGPRSVSTRRSLTWMLALELAVRVRSGVKRLGAFCTAPDYVRGLLSRSSAKILPKREAWLFLAPALRECRHRGLARRLVAVCRRAQ